MPELPDLVYVARGLHDFISGRIIEQVEVREPIVVRNLTGEPFGACVTGRGILNVRRHGPFLVFELTGHRMIVAHPMLAGAFSIEPKSAGLITFIFKEGKLSYLDAKKMGKIYVVDPGQEAQIPRFTTQGVDITSSEFTEDVFLGLIRASRRQVRAFLMEQEQISAIGNAYADEILFEARIHPKTFCHQLGLEEQKVLYDSIRKVIDRGIKEVQGANAGLHVKYRDHMLVRNKKNEPCPRCGAKIRRESVLGYDTFFCPACQPAKRKLFIDWK